MTQCNKAIKKGCMVESRPCLRPKGHQGYHVPDLAGATFGNGSVTVLERVAPFGGKAGTKWKIKNSYTGRESKAEAKGLIYGQYTGRRHGFYQHNGKSRPEYRTVKRHHVFIFHSCRYPTYQNMPFHEDWNPDKGGAIWKGAKWIIENLGPKPGPAWSMDIIKHELGFVPGNLRWALKNLQASNKQHRILGQFSNEEFETEAKKRGYMLVRAQ